MAVQDIIRLMEQPDPIARAKARAFFELSPVVMCITGLADGRVRDVNDAFLRLHGVTRAEVMEGVPKMIPEIQVEATFPDGTKLVTVHQPIV